MTTPSYRHTQGLRLELNFPPNCPEKNPKFEANAALCAFAVASRENLADEAEDALLALIQPYDEVSVEEDIFKAITPQPRLPPKFMLWVLLLRAYRPGAFQPVVGKHCEIQEVHDAVQVEVAYRNWAAVTGSV